MGESSHRHSQSLISEVILGLIQLTAEMNIIHRLYELEGAHDLMDIVIVYDG